MTKYREPDWIEDPPVPVLPMPIEAKDEYHERIFQVLSELHGWGHSSQHLEPTADRPFRVLELIANSDEGPRETRLWIIDAAEGLLAYVVGQGEPDEREIAVWRTASDLAMDRLGMRSPVGWRAYLTYRAASLPVQIFRLRDRTTLADGTVLAPVDGLMSTDVMGSVGQILSTQHLSTLIRVDGSTECWAWHGDGTATAIRRLRLLSALLSVALNTPWVLRDGPTDHVDARWAGSPGPLSGMHYGWTEEASAHFSPEPQPLPEWFTQADSALVSAGTNSAIQRAVLMHHEGELVMKDHPSLAMLSFVASIETLSTTRDRPERCPTCRAVTGSTQRFRHAVDEVLPNGEAAMLSRAYNRRSRTVHDSHLHGREATSGAWGEMSLYRADRTMYFEVAEVGTARRASIVMLLRALGINDPD